MALFSLSSSGWNHNLLTLHKVPLNPCVCGSPGRYRLDRNVDWSLLPLPPTSHLHTYRMCGCAYVCRGICVQFVSRPRLPPRSPNTQPVFFPSPSPTFFFSPPPQPAFILALSVRLIPLSPSLGCQLGVWSHFLKAAFPEDGRLIELWPFSEWVKHRINAQLLERTHWGEKKRWEKWERWIMKVYEQGYYVLYY